MVIYFAVTSQERDQLLGRVPDGTLDGQDQIEFDLSGVEEDSLWVKVEMPEAEARQFETEMHPDWPLRQFAFPPETLSALAVRDADPDDFPDAPWRLRRAAATVVDRIAERTPAGFLRPVRAALEEGDGPESMRRLAWVIREENIAISVNELVALRTLGEQADGTMPPSLGEHVRLPD